MQELLRLLADPTRLRILAALEPGELAVNEIAETLGMGQSRVSNHLRLLKAGGALLVRREGAWTFYRNALDTRGEAGGVWRAVREGLARDEGLAHDRLRREAVLERRRQRSRRHFAAARPDAALESGSLREELLAALHPRSLVVVDAGCGDGFLTETLAERFDAVLAFDHAAPRLEAARRRVPHPHVRFEQADLDRLPLDDASADVVFLSLVLHHVAELRATLREAERILRPGGRVAVADLAPHDEESMRETMGDLRLGLDPAVLMADLASAGFVAVRRMRARDRLVAAPRRSLELFLATAEKPPAARRKRARSRAR